MRPMLMRSLAPQERVAAKAESAEACKNVRRVLEPIKAVAVLMRTPLYIMLGRNCLNTHQF
jgi:hypothetical protein